jgi:hypothetical protein
MVKKVKNEQANSSNDKFHPLISFQDYERITVIAYYKAESRGFEPGHELSDWFEAEQEFLQREDYGGIF